MLQLAEKSTSENVKIAVFSAEVFLLGYALEPNAINTLRTGDADLRFYVTTVQDG